MVQRKCACGGTCPRCADDERTLQPKLKIGEPGDRYEQEADALADRVMRMGNGGGSALPSSRPAVRASPVPHSTSLAGMGTAPPSVDAALSSPARPLPADARAFFESRLGADFSGVRIHSDPVSQQAAHEIGARAFTVGRDLVFGAGQFVPGSADGRRLLAHELAHVLQQTDVVQREVDEATSPLPRGDETGSDSGESATPDAAGSTVPTQFPHCDLPDCHLCAWLAERFFRDNVSRLHSWDTIEAKEAWPPIIVAFSDACSVDITVEGCHQYGPWPHRFSCWGQALITCPGSDPVHVRYIVRHPGGETFIVEAGSLLCEYERECLREETPSEEDPVVDAPDESGPTYRPTLKKIRCTGPRRQRRRRRSGRRRRARTLPDRT
jgi:hypothetical protein